MEHFEEQKRINLNLKNNADMAKKQQKSTNYKDISSDDFEEESAVKQHTVIVSKS